jgi:hypothetical protein
MTVPFADSTETEVVTRVFVAYVKLVHRRHPSTYGTWPSMRHKLDQDLSRFNQPLGLYTALLACIEAKRQGIALTTWATEAITAARAGYTWRRCFYPQYKACRDPRVTNRGVIEAAPLATAKPGSTLVS